MKLIMSEKLEREPIEVHKNDSDWHENSDERRVVVVMLDPI